MNDTNTAFHVCPRHDFDLAPDPAAGCEQCNAEWAPLTRDEVQALALRCGFSLKDLGDGRMGLKHYVWDFARFLLAAARPTMPAARDVLAERARQISAEGWTPEHDDQYSAGDMATAAACYAMQGRFHFPTPGQPGPLWPWAAEWWKPGDYRRNLVKAAALLLAEIERLDRAAAAQAQEGK